MNATAVQVFLGKGGVGKTTCSAATALRHAEAGARSLVLSTDPTPSLAHVFELDGALVEREVRPSLHATELGLDAVRAMWDERFGREVYAVFSSFVDVDYATFVEFTTSVLPGLADEFMVDWIRRTAAEGRYANVVWDTAPLGQTLALLGMPRMLGDHLRMAPRVYSHLKASGDRRQSVMDVLRGWQQLSELCLEFLRRDVGFSLVTIPEALSVRQVDGVLAELARHGLEVGRIVVNHVVETVDSPFLAEKATAQRPHLDWLRERCAATGRMLVELPEFPHEVRGLDRLRAVGTRLCGTAGGT